MKIKYYTHSTILLILNNVKILVDPFFTNNPITNYNINKLKDIDYILVTHAHYDHVADVECISKKFNAIIISNYEICQYFKNKKCFTFSINFGNFIKFNNFFIKYVWALHSSSFIDGSYGGNPGGFIIKYKKKNIYISGDTDYFFDMKYFIKKKINLLILPIGGRYTMNYKGAYLTSKLLKCNNILGVHYNTFPEIKINKKKIKLFFKKKRKRIFLLKENKTIVI
ncbi:MAG: metal-dependent hydrolase [Candidatus Shikimatogenerans bostrichidophilus]|nr:MAG: metal-dependent hydrolase [Candidatus Shikimatogenerans bostrichidophilus]